MKIIVPWVLLLMTLCYVRLAFSETLAQPENQFDPGKLYQVMESKGMYHILTSSPFKDTQARRSLTLLAKAVLLKHMQNTNKQVTGLEIKGFGVERFYEHNGRLYAVASVDKKNITPLFDKAIKTEETSAIAVETARLEAMEPKNKAMHEQLKELYFLAGDINNFEKQADILLEIKFNED